MPVIKDFTTNEIVVSIRFPSETIRSSLLRLQFPSEIAKLSILEAKVFLAVIVREFLKGNIYLEEMAEIVHSLGNFFMDHKTEDKVDGHSLEEITFDASEMIIGIRHIFPSPARDTYDWYLLHLLEYLRLNQQLFERVTDVEYKKLSYFEPIYNENYKKYLSKFSISSYK